MADKGRDRVEVSPGMMPGVFKEAKDSHALNFPQQSVLQIMWLPCGFHVATEQEPALLPHFPFHSSHSCEVRVTTVCLLATSERFSGFSMCFFPFGLSMTSLHLALLRAYPSL